MDYQYPLEETEKNLIYETKVDRNAPDSAIKTFFHQIQRTGLDPLSNQIHLVKTGSDSWSVMTGIDGFRLIANRTGDYAGSDKALHEINDDGALVVSQVTVWKMVQGVRCSFTSESYWAEYFPGEKKGFMWKKMPHVMLSKTAEAQALRKSFPQELSGLYTTEELDQARTEEVPMVAKPPEKPLPELTEGIAYAGTVFSFKHREGKNPAIIDIEHDGDIYHLSTFSHPEGMPWELIEDAAREQTPCHFTVTRRESKGTTYTNLNELTLVDTNLHPERDEIGRLMEEIAQIEMLAPSVVLASFGVMGIDELSVEDCREIAPLMRTRIIRGNQSDTESAEEAVSG